MSSLNKASFKCPAPISNNNNETITNFEGKKLMIVTFLEGRAKQNLSPANCKTIGSEVAKMHELTKSLKLNRQNDLSVNSWRKLFNSVKDKCENIHKDLPRLIEENLNDVEKNWPKNLPRGIIHADLFHDNIFFVQDKFSGVIDFYFSCNDFYAYEIAICLNAWCFEDSNNEFNPTKAKYLLGSYNQERKFSNEEVEALPLLARASALRYLLTRLLDFYSHEDSDLILKKDPNEYISKLRFHQSVRKASEYGL